MPPGFWREVWGGGTAGQHGGDLLGRAKVPQRVQQPGRSGRVLDGGVGGDTAGQHGDLLVRADLPQHAQQPDQGFADQWELNGVRAHPINQEDVVTATGNF